MDAREFQPFGISHWVAIATTLAVGTILLRWFRRADVPAPEKRKAMRLLGIVLCVAVALDPVLTLIRYRTDLAHAWQLLVENSLPLYLCDVVSLLLAWALFTGRQRLAEVGYFWSVAGTTQGLLTPTLYFDWNSLEYYAFFAQHGGAPIAGMLLTFGLGLAPQPGYFKRMLYWSWGYMLASYLLNLLMSTNYGFINAKPNVATLFDYMGPWPFYLIPLQLIAFSAYLILGWLATRINRRFPLTSYPTTTSPSSSTPGAK